MPYRSDRKVARVLLATVVLASGALLVPSLAHAQATHTDEGFIEYPNAGVAAARTEFIANCPAMPESQGVDAWIFDLPAGIPAGSVATISGQNATGDHDLTGSVFLEDCAFDAHYSDAQSQDVEIVLPEAAGFIAVVTAAGLDTTVSLEVGAAADPSPSPTGTEPPPPPPPSGGTRGTYPTTPNDPLFPEQDLILGGQWGMRKIQAPEAWQLPRATGHGIKVAVLDSGLDLDHPDFQCPGKIEVIGNPDFVGDGNGPEDGNGHGTHVAGIVGACTNNNEGVVGVAPDSTILPVQVLDAAGDGNLTLLAPAIRAATDAGAHVINMSIGGLQGVSTIDMLISLFPDVDEAVEYAVSKGVVLVAAAGNETYPMCSVPAVAEDIICVGATDNRDVNAYYSNFPVKDDDDDIIGPAVMAPGGSGQVFCDFHAENIVSTYLVSEDSCDEGYVGYQGIDGTSMASPHVAGVAALVYDRLGGARTAENGRAVIDAIINTTVDLYAPGYDPASGYGRVDALAAASAVAVGTDPSPSPSPSPTEPTVESTSIDGGDLPSSGQYTDSVSLSATLKDSAGLPIAGERVSFQIVGDEGFREASAVTDAVGKASASIDLDLLPGDYEVVAAYAGKADRYDSSSASAPFTVLAEDSVTTLVEGTKGSNKHTLTVTVADADDAAYEVAGGVVAFYANGQYLGEGTTNENGSVTFSIPSGYKGSKNTYTASFVGNSLFLGSSSS
jgi:subtilisin family serine protease